MAYTKLTDDWRGCHRFSQFMVRNQYGVYLDNDDLSKDPYIVIQGFRIRSNGNAKTQISDHAPFAIKVQINGDGEEYSFDSGDNIKYSGDYRINPDVLDMDEDQTFFIEFSSNVHITVPTDAEPFTINTTLVDKNGEEFSFIEHAAGPYVNKISGPDTINTGAINEYTLSHAMCNIIDRSAGATAAAKIIVSSWMQFEYEFPSLGRRHKAGCYINPYQKIELSEGWRFQQDDTETEFNKFEVVPFYTDRLGTEQEEQEGPEEEVSSYAAITGGANYYPHDSGFGDKAWYIDFWGYNYGRYPDEYTITICSTAKEITVTTREEIDAALDPILLRNSVSESNQATLSKFGAYVQNNVSYKYSIAYKGSQTDTYGISRGILPYGAYLCKAIVNDYSSGVLKTFIWSNEDSATYPIYITPNTFSYNTDFQNAVNNTKIEYILSDNVGREYTFTDSFSILPYTEPEITQFDSVRCSIYDGSVTGQTYLVDGTKYVEDDYGEYCIVKWGFKIDPINNKNDRDIRITIDHIYSLATTGYTQSGFFAKKIGTEKSYTVQFTVHDHFKWKDISMPLSTVPAILDFLNGGSGVGIGKVAETKKAVEVHRTWDVLMPQQITVGSYNNDGTDQDMRSWMLSVENKLQELEDMQYVYVVDTNNNNCSRFHGVTGLVVLDSSTQLRRQKNITNAQTGQHYTDYDDAYMYIDRQDAYGGAKISEPLRIIRPYLVIKAEYNVYFDGAYENPSYQPNIYLSTSDPQGPSSSYVISRVIPGTFHHDRSTGYSEYYSYSSGAQVVIDVSNYLGRDLWVYFAFSGHYQNSSFIDIRNIYFKSTNGGD